MDFLRFLFRRHPLPTVLLVVVLVLGVWFGVRLTSDMLYFADPAHREQTFAGWMTPRYIAKSWGLPPEIVADVLDLPRDHRRITMDELAATEGTTLEQLQARIQAAKAEYEANRPRPRDVAPPPASDEGKHD